MGANGRPRGRRRRWSSPPCGLPLLLLVVGGCGNSPIGPRICPRPATEEPIPVCVGTVTGNAFSSLGAEGELLKYDGGAFFRIHHGLGVVPNYPRAFLSNSRFIDAPDTDELPRSLAPAAGNQFEIKALTDTYIDILNGTCVDENFLLVQTEAPGLDTAPIQGSLRGCTDLRARLDDVDDEAGDGGARP
ncbi:MAG: hypothetical protein AAF928_06730 [Myxococcota bacterium]